MANIKKLLCGCFLMSGILLVQGDLPAQTTFQQVEGDFNLVVMEAENFTEMIPVGDNFWDFIQEPDFYSGEGAITANAPNAPFADASSALNNSPILIYDINFVVADTTFIWVRASHLDGGDDSFHAGFDTQITSLTDRIGFHGNGVGEWAWLGVDMDDDRPRFFVDSPGLHQFQIFVRENGIKIDKIVLTTLRDYDPLIFHDELGPDETISAVENIPAGANPEAFQLIQNYPNPFNPATTISYNLAKAGQVNLTVYDVLGNVVATLVDGFRSAGQHQVTWNALSSENTTQASGVYFARLTAGAQEHSIRMLFLK